MRIWSTPPPPIRSFQHRGITHHLIICPKQALRWQPAAQRQPTRNKNARLTLLFWYWPIRTSPMQQPGWRRKKLVKGTMNGRVSLLLSPKPEPSPAALAPMFVLRGAGCGDLGGFPSGSPPASRTHCYAHEPPPPPLAQQKGKTMQRKESLPAVAEYGSMSWP